LFLLLVVGFLRRPPPPNQQPPTPQLQSKKCVSETLSINWFRGEV
jgi:hypothetical protein